MSITLIEVLAKTDYLLGAYKKMLSRYIQYFQPENLTDPYTVADKLCSCKTNITDFISTLLNIEKSATDSRNIELVVDGNHWGTFTAAELIKLKDILEDPDFMELLSTISETALIRNLIVLNTIDEALTVASDSSIPHRPLQSERVMGYILEGAASDLIVLP